MCTRRWCGTTWEERPTFFEYAAWHWDAVAGVVQGAVTSGDERMTEKDGVIRVNRAPVLTLWVAIVAERLGRGGSKRAISR